jgi:hypothetical protein
MQGKETQHNRIAHDTKLRNYKNNVRASSVLRGGGCLFYLLELPQNLVVIIFLLQALDSRKTLASVPLLNPHMNIALSFSCIFFRKWICHSNDKQSRSLRLSKLLANRGDPETLRVLQRQKKKLTELPHTTCTFSQTARS